MAARTPRPTDLADYDPDTLPDSQPFDRRPDESPHAYEAFTLFCSLPHTDRALKRVAHDLEKAYEAIKVWSSQWQWRERVKYYDAHMAKVAREAEEREVAEHAAKWKRRAIEAAETSWSHSELAAKTALDMLSRPWVKWTTKDAVAFMKLAAELRSDALGNALGSVDDGFDPMNATPEECQAYLERKGMINVGVGVSVNVNVGDRDKGNE